MTQDHLDRHPDPRGRETNPGLSDGHQPGQQAEVFVFPEWTNRLRELSALLVIGGLFYLAVLLILFFAPETSAIGYSPEQPVPYSHALHVGQLGMDCRYCHSTVEQAAHANLPPTQTCMNCHALIRKESEKLLPVRESHASGLPIPWVRVHDLPDFVYFNHSAHLRAGVGCVSCHGRIDKMEVVRQAKPLSMGWCLACHQNPDQHLRPTQYLTAMDWIPEESPAELGKKLREAQAIAPSTDCTTCHR